MKSEIIRSESSLRRYPAIAFILSFLFTGMGQAYNGELSRAIVFFALRILSLIIIPLLIVTRPGDFSGILLLMVAAINIIIWIASSLEALFSAKPKNPYNLKSWNSLLFYFVYGIISSTILIFCVLFNTAFFSIERIDTVNMTPYFKPGDYILLDKYYESIDIGDVLLFSQDKGNLETGRVIARYGDVVSKKGDYYINGKVLKRGIFSKEEMQELNLPNSEDLFFEINGGRKYPVLFDQKKSNNRVKQVLITDDEFFIAFDNRIINDQHVIIKPSVIRGKVGSVIYAKDGFKASLKKIFSKPFTSAD